MITPMKKITVFALRNSRKSVVDELQKMGCVEFEKVKETDEVLSIGTEETLQDCERYMRLAKQALELLDGINPEKKDIFAEKEKISINNYSMSGERTEQIIGVVFDIIEKNKGIAANKEKIAQKQAEILSLEPWDGLDTALNSGSTRNTEFFPYTVNSSISVSELDDLLGDITGAYFEIVSVKSDLSCIWVATLKSSSRQVHKRLRKNGYVMPSVTAANGTAKEKIRGLREEIKGLTAESLKIAEELTALCEKRGEIKLLYDYMKLRAEKYRALEKLEQTRRTFVLSGFVPEDRAQEVKAVIENKGTVYAKISDIEDGEQAPVLFRNNSFARPVEEITSTYSMPSPRDIDPNGIMAFFYYLFFGMMFSDAGYGILLVLATAYLGFVKKFKRDLMKMFFFCGISTTFWGFMYGSFFGDLVYRFSITFLGKEVVLSPVWVDPAKEPLTLLIFSILLGLVQILVGLSINFYMHLRAGEKSEAVFDTGAWILIILGLVLTATGMLLEIPVIKSVGIGMAVVGALTIVLMKGRANKNIIMRLLSGILGLYDITSYVSDALSYSRLMALGLATGVIAQVVNIMGALAGKSVLGFIMFVVVFTVGHLLNFSINMLGAYVHTNRLQYVEFYSKFYEGGGRAFKPLKMDTEYYEFTEKI